MWAEQNRQPEYGANILVAKKRSITSDYDNTKIKLGRGMNGYVYLWRKKSTRKLYAIKKLKKCRQAENEIRLQWKSMEGCPNILGIHELYNHSGYYWVVFEFMKGGRLIDRLKAKRSEITEYDVAGLMHQICKAVNHIHKIGIAHRDLKPENLLFETEESDSTLKLADFGFAKYTSQGLHSRKFTPYYVAPEVLTFSNYTKSCDIWSLGVIMYILCCGEPPFQSKHQSMYFSAGMKARIKRGEYDFDSKEWSLVSDEAKNLVSNMLQVDPNKRFTIEQVMESNWMRKYNEAPQNRLGSLVKMRSPFNFLNNQKVLKMIFDEVRDQDIQAPIPVLKPISEITNNDLLNKRMSRKASVASSINININIEETVNKDCEKVEAIALRANRKTDVETYDLAQMNLLLLALYYSILLKFSNFNL